MAPDSPLEDFWEASSLHPHNISAFAARLLTHTDSDLPVHPLTPTGRPIPLPTVNDRTQRLLKQRRSGRSFREGTLDTKPLGRLLSSVGDTLIPAAGGIESRFTYVMCGAVAEPFAEQTFQYRARDHALARVGPAPDRNERRRLFSLECEGEPHVLIVSVIHLDELRYKYGDRALRFALQQVGHAHQNLSLRAAADGLAAYVLGGALDDELLDALGLLHTSALIGGAMAVGLPAGTGG